MATDPDYKENQRNAQKKWQEDNPDYWCNYRKKGHKPPIIKRAHQRIKMDTLQLNFHLVPGRYEIKLRIPPDVKMDAIRAKIITES